MKDYTEDYYNALGIEFEATPKEIRDAYRKAALQNHPDKTNGDKAATARFLIIQEGYEVLADPVQKMDYDTRCYPRINRSHSGGRTHVPEQYSEAKAEAPSRPKPQPEKFYREDVDSICADFEFDAAFIKSLAKRERRFMYDWNQNESCRADTLMSMARDFQTTFERIEEIVAMAKEGKRQGSTKNKRKGKRFQQQQAGIDWPVGFLTHLDDLVEAVQYTLLETVSEAVPVCIMIIMRRSWSCLMPAPCGPKRGPRRGPKRIMTEDGQLLEKMMRSLLWSWRETEKVLKRIESELQMAESQVD